MTATWSAHQGTSLVSREEVMALVTPDARSSTHRVVPHSEVIFEITGELARRNLTLAKESYSLSPDGNRLFGVLDTRDEAAVPAVIERLSSRRFAWVISLDDELPLCRVASAVVKDRFSGAFLESLQGGRRTYTDDVEPWFGMGLLAKDGKQAADDRKIDNRIGMNRSSPCIHSEKQNGQQNTDGNQQAIRI